MRRSWPPPTPSARRHAVPADAARTRSWFCRRRFQPDQRQLEITGIAQAVHHLHQIAIAQRLVGADEDGLLLVIAGRAIERASERIARHDALADRDCTVALDGDEH